MSTTPRVPLRQLRERDLVNATRALFDERGLQEAPIEEIARTVGIARGLVYRHFSSKEELFVLTVTDYLRELGDLLEEAVAAEADLPGQLERLTEAFARYCQRYPAFLDCSLALMRRPAGDLREIVSESVWLRLGAGMGRCIGAVGDVLHAGRDDGSFSVADPDYTANVLWTQGLGMMHLARIKVGLRQGTGGLPELFPVSAEDVVESCVQSALALAGTPRRAG